MTTRADHFERDPRLNTLFVFFLVLKVLSLFFTAQRQLAITEILHLEINSWLSQRRDVSPQED